MYRNYRIPPMSLPSSIHYNSNVTSPLLTQDFSQSSLVHKLQNKKKHFIGASQQYSHISESLSKVKQKLFKQTTTQKKSIRPDIKIKNLINKISNTLVLYNTSLQLNSNSKKQIDKHRTTKNKNKQIMKLLEQDIKQNLNLLQKQKKQISNLQLNREQDYKYLQELKQQNEEMKLKYQKEIDAFMKMTINKEHQSPVKKKYAYENDRILDTHLILKNRLKTLIQKNKKVTQQVGNYQSILSGIKGQFQELMKRQKVEKIEDILGLFTSTYKQHQSLYEYINKLSSSITALQGDINGLKSKINVQKKQNQIASKQNTQTQRIRNSVYTYKQIIKQKTNKISQFKNTVLQQISPKLKQTLIELNKFQNTPLNDYHHNFDLNQKSLETYLCDLQKHMNKIYQISRLSSKFKNGNKFTRLPIPLTNQTKYFHTPSYPVFEQKQNNQFSKYLFNSHDFNQFAQEYLDNIPQKSKKDILL